MGPACGDAALRGTAPGDYHDRGSLQRDCSVNSSWGCLFVGIKTSFLLHFLKHYECGYKNEGALFPCLSHKRAGGRKGRGSVIKVHFPHQEAGLRVCQAGSHTGPHSVPPWASQFLICKGGWYSCLAVALMLTSLECLKLWQSGPYIAEAPQMTAPAMSIIHTSKAEAGDNRPSGMPFPPSSTPSSASQGSPGPVEPDPLKHKLGQGAYLQPP